MCLHFEVCKVTAYACLKRAEELTWLVQVYERAKNYRECGAGITLDVNGMKALRAVDEELFSSFQSTVVTNVNSMQNFDQHGKRCQSHLRQSC